MNVICGYGVSILADASQRPANFIFVLAQRALLPPCNGLGEQKFSEIVVVFALGVDHQSLLLRANLVVIQNHCQLGLDSLYINLVVGHQNHQNAVQQLIGQFLIFHVITSFQKKVSCPFLVSFNSAGFHVSTFLVETGVETGAAAFAGSVNEQGIFVSFAGESATFSGFSVNELTFSGLFRELPEISRSICAARRRPYQMPSAA